MVSSIKQARQFIVHEQISLGSKKITAPSFLVLLEEESSIQFAQNSVFLNASHPGRIAVDERKKRKKTKEKNESQDKVKAKDESEKKPKKEKETRSEGSMKERSKEEKVPTAHYLKKQKEELTEAKED